MQTKTVIVGIVLARPDVQRVAMACVIQAKTACVPIVTVLPIVVRSDSFVWTIAALIAVAMAKWMPVKPVPTVPTTLVALVVNVAM